MIGWLVDEEQFVLDVQLALGSFLFWGCVFIIDHVRLHDGRHGEGQGARIDDTDRGSISRGVNDGEEGEVQSIFAENFNGLDAVGRPALEFDTCMHGTTIRLQQDLDAFDSVRKGKRLDGVTIHAVDVAPLSQILDDGTRSRGTIAASQDVFNVRYDTCTHGELQLVRVLDGNRVVVVGHSHDSTEGVLASVFGEKADLLGGVVRSLPQGDVGAEWVSIVLEEDLDPLDVAVLDSPRLEAVSLDLLGGGSRPKAFDGLLDGTRPLPTTSDALPGCRSSSRSAEGKILLLEEKLLFEGFVFVDAVRQGSGRGLGGRRLDDEGSRALGENKEGDELTVDLHDDEAAEV